MFFDIPRVKMIVYMFLSLFAIFFSCSKKDDTSMPVPYVHFDVPVIITNSTKGPQGMYKADVDSDGDTDLISAALTTLRWFSNGKVP